MLGQPPRFGLGGLPFLLAFGRPNFEEDGMKALFRPNGIALHKDGSTKRLQFNWSAEKGGGWVTLDFANANATPDPGVRAIVLPDERRI